ncbi:FtsX-like permease family protein [Candidatus Dependentiae bacterium]|nr:FtsX-like permease family protein [Candidatus Dependentiae bacterium]
MNINLLLKTSIRCIKKHKGRSFLTILGIIIGIGSIISTLSIGYGAEEKLKKQILSMGHNFIFIQPGKMVEEGKTNLTQRKKPNHITEKDVLIFQHQIPEIKKITPIMFARDIISNDCNNVLVDIKCGNENYLDIIGRKIKIGNSFTKHHLAKSSKVVVLGSKTAKDLFNSLNPIGKTIKIKNVFYTIIGITKKINNYMGIMDPNLDIYLPISTARKQIFQKNSNKVHGIAISIYNTKDIPKVVRKINRILRFHHRLEKTEPNDFTIIDQQSMINAAKTSSNILTLLLLIIASISLLVGGIGVMNIMLVSVSERTQEIGIRMAIGATTEIILKQFIFEAITLCLIGGIIGILFGIIIPHIISLFTSWPVVIKLSSIIFAFTVTFMVGVIFGYYPAKKAAKLNPVNALIGK